MLNRLKTISEQLLPGSQCGSVLAGQLLKWYLISDSCRKKLWNNKGLFILPSWIFLKPLTLSTGGHFGRSSKLMAVLSHLSIWSDSSMIAWQVECLLEVISVMPSLSIMEWNRAVFWFPHFSLSTLGQCWKQCLQTWPVVFTSKHTQTGSYSTRHAWRQKPEPIHCVSESCFMQMTQF